MPTTTINVTGLPEEVIRNLERLVQSLRAQFNEIAPGPGAAAMTNEQRIAEWHAWGLSHPPLGYIVDDSRESIYEGRGE